MAWLRVPLLRPVRDGALRRFPSGFSTAAIRSRASRLRTRIISGYGEYRFGTNGYATQLAAALNRGPVRRYLGNVTNGMLNGSGRLDWADNSFFEGEFSGDRPWRGMMALPDGTVLYGTFNDGRLNGPGVELRAGTARWGNWSNGALPVPNPPA
jgi:hypothetical protein